MRTGLGVNAKQGILALLLTLAVTLLNSLFQVASGRFLGPADFSLLSVLFVGISIAGVASGGLQVIAAKDIAGRASSVSPHHNLDKQTRSTFILFVALGISIIAISPLLAEIFDSSPLSFVLLGILMPSSGLYAIVNGRLQGKKRIVSMGLLAAMLSATKLFLGSLLFFLGFGVNAILVLLILSTYSYVTVFLITTRKFGHVNTPAWSSRVWHASVVQTAFWLVLGLDVIMARILFPPDIAGKFIAVDVVAKTILIIPSLILIVLLPRFVELRSEGASSARTAIFASGITVVMMVIPSLLLAIFGDRVIAILFGTDYILASGLVGFLAIMMLPIGIAGVLLQFHLAGETWRYAVALTLVALISIPLYMVAQGSIFQFSAVLGLAGTLSLLVLVPTRAYRSSLLIVISWVQR